MIIILSRHSATGEESWPQRCHSAAGEEFHIFIEFLTQGI